MAVAVGRHAVSEGMLREGPMERRDEAGEGIDLGEWLEMLRSAPELAGVDVTRDEQRALLDLTRTAAHRSERVAAPITAYVVGVALAAVPAAGRAERIRGLAARLEAAPRPAAEG